MKVDLLQALEASDITRTNELFVEEMRKGGDPREVHLALFPEVQRVLNPPFINPHLPKDVPHLPPTHALPERG